MLTRLRWFPRGGLAALAATVVLALPAFTFGQTYRPGGNNNGNGNGNGNNNGGNGQQQGGVGQRALMVNPNSQGGDRMYQYSSATGSGILQGPLIIQTQFGGAGGIGGTQYAGGGGFAQLGALGNAAGNPNGQQGNQYSMFPPGFQLHFAYNTLVGLPTQQGVNAGFAQGAPPPTNGFPGGNPYGFPGGGFPGGGFPGGGFPGGGFPGKFGAFGNGGYGY
jgi:hypothetical protein